jgi:hypothetical protein
MKEEQKQHLIDMMKSDEKLGLYEEPKQETLEEAAERFYHLGIWTAEESLIRRLAFINGAKWQQERMYSKEEVKFIKGLINFYWVEHNNEHESNLKEFELSKSILNKL